MKTFRACMDEVYGLPFIYENLPLQSGVGRDRLLGTAMITDPDKLQQALDDVCRMRAFVEEKRNHIAMQVIKKEMQQVHDIYPTLARLSDGQVLNDIELFEIKRFGLLLLEIRETLLKSKFTLFPFHDLSPAIDLLDPEGTRVPHFYIYSVYDERLERVRKKIAQASDDDEKEKLQWENLQIEDDIREKLSRQLLPHALILRENLDQVALLDILIAKAEQSITLRFATPVISKKKTSLHGLFNPELKSHLEKSARKYQPVDIELYPEPCLITGANMSGKTVLLKSIALLQYLFQFGFHVPAVKAEIVPVDEILCSFEDRHSELSGLSSFTEEILKMDQMIKKVKKGDRVLILVDELARTTNPDEGKALVNAFLQLMASYQVLSLVTTHYSGITARVRKLKVKGLILTGNENGITARNMNDYMDYSLIETDEQEVPAEALKIAEIFDVDPEFLALARQSYAASKEDH